MKKKLLVLFVVAALAASTLLAFSACDFGETEMDRFIRVERDLRAVAAWYEESVVMPAGATAAFMFVRDNPLALVQATFFTDETLARNYQAALSVAAAASGMTVHGAGLVVLFTTANAMDYLRFRFNNPGLTPPPITGGTQPPPTNQPPGPQAIRGAGTWTVGVGASFDIAPGRFKILQVGNIDAAISVATVAGSFSPSNDGFVFQQIFRNRGYVDLEAGQFIRIDRGAIWTLEDAAAFNIDADYWPEGQFMVGRDIPAGTFRAIPTHASIQGAVTVSTAPRTSVANQVGIHFVPLGGQALFTLAEGQFVDVARARLERA